MIFHYFSQYYNDEPLARDFIKKIALHHNTHDQFAARDLGNKKIYDKITPLFGIALGSNKRQFTEDDLKDPWYLNSTGWCTCHDNKHATLLRAAIKNHNTKQVEILLNAGIDIYHKNTNPIQFMVQNFYGNLDKEKRAKFRKIARLLIRKGIDPDSRFFARSPTLLHAAAAYNDRKFATFLMKKGANPYKLWVNKDIGASISSDELLTEYDDRIPHFHNAFSINTQARDWLERIYSEIQKKNKRINQNRF